MSFMSKSQTDEFDQLADELHRLDSEIDKVRRRIIWLERTLVSPDENEELAGLRRRYNELSEQFVQTYKQWNRQA